MPEKIVGRYNASRDNIRKVIKDIDNHNKKLTESNKRHFSNEIEGISKYYHGAVFPQNSKEYKDILGKNKGLKKFGKPLDLMSHIIFENWRNQMRQN